MPIRPDARDAIHGAVSAASSIVRVLSLLAWPVLMAGCASLTPEQCLQADWRQIGFSDGSQGLPGSRINDHAKACATQGIRPHLDDYLQGRAQGLRSYCQPENGFAIGRRGAEHNVADCPDSMKPAFAFQYERGHQIYLVESELARQRSHIDRNNRHMHRNDERIAVIRDDLKKDDLPAERRIALLNEFDRLVEEKDALSRENAFLRAESERLQMHVQMRLREFGRF